MLNRSAVILRPKQPFNDWLKSVFPDKDYSDDGGEPTVYLIPGFDDDEGRLASLEAVYEVLFATELNAWYTDEERWPSDWTLEMFEEWFTVETYGIVEDTWAEEGPVEEEKLD
jgi:hypothetical protein